MLPFPEITFAHRGFSNTCGVAGDLVGFLDFTTKAADHHRKLRTKYSCFDLKTQAARSSPYAKCIFHIWYFFMGQIKPTLLSQDHMKINQCSPWKHHPAQGRAKKCAPSVKGQSFLFQRLVTGKMIRMFMLPQSLKSLNCFQCDSQNNLLKSPSSLCTPFPVLITSLS